MVAVGGQRAGDLIERLDQLLQTAAAVWLGTKR